MTHYEFCSFHMDGSSAKPGFEVIKKFIEEKFHSVELRLTQQSLFRYRISVWNNDPDKEDAIMDYVRGIVGGNNYFTIVMSMFMFKTKKVN